MLPAIALSAIFALVGVCLALAAFRIGKVDTRNYVGRDRFFARYFRVFWILACAIGSVCLFRAAWYVWFSPYLAALNVLAIPALAILLIVIARALLPWFYDRRKR